MEGEPIAQVQGMTTDPDGTEVQVEVVGNKITGDFTMELRARARALASAGVGPTVSDSLEGITSGEINRFTKVRDDPVIEQRGALTEARLYTVIVGRKMDE